MDGVSDQISHQYEILIDETPTESKTSIDLFTSADSNTDNRIEIQDVTNETIELSKGYLVKKELKSI